MLKKNVMLLFGAALLAGCSLLGSVGIVPPEIAQNNAIMLQRCRDVNGDFQAAQMDMATALGLQKEVEDKIAAIKTTGEGTEADVDKLYETSREINEIILEKMRESEPLSDAAKKLMRTGLLKYATGTTKMAVLGKDTLVYVNDIKNKAMSASPTDKIAMLGSIDTLATLVGEMPGMLTDVVDTGKQFITYAQGQGIDTKQAAAALTQAEDADK
ncbi:MAG: hypothetical protein LBQ63_03915 [Deltaproteobacteria bacterium]|jgi:hypothetical protein|nr:hypothetical protein [Deltaproteobacteria bacterium]